MPFSLIPFMLLIIPIVEISVFIVIGDKIGLFYTVMTVLITAVMGSILLRIEGFRVLGKIQQAMAAGQIPAKEMTNGVMILIAGVLLLTPGFVTDAIGFLLFLPPVRAAIRTFLVSRIKVNTVGAGFEGFTRDPFHPQDMSADDEDGPIVDLDEDSWTHEENPSSPWNKKLKDDSSDK